MKKELEFLYEGNCNENPFVFETPELQEQMDSVFSYFQKRHAEKGQEALCEFCLLYTSDAADDAMNV